MTPAPAPGFPEHGLPADQVVAELLGWRSGDLEWRDGRAFSLVYHPDDATLERILHEVAAEFLHENALNPFAYESLPKIENDIVTMAADLFGGPADAGAVTSGGTESIFLAVHTAREQARAERGIESPRIVTATTAHPAFAKAAHYLDVTHIKVPVGPDLRIDLDALENAIDERTALVVASAPCYPYGVIDPVPEVAAQAAAAGTLCHVDACLGGWLLPFWARIGEPVAPWDLSVAGVTSLSADVHKYGYTFKGASTILYADRDLLKRQFFLYDDWPGGLYGSATTAGTRPAAPLAGAWAAIRHLGADGYERLARVVRDATRRLQAGIGAIDGLSVTGDPDLSVFEFGSDHLDIGAVGDVMDDRGWNLDRQPGGLHVMVSPYHARVVDRFLADLADAAVDHGESRDVTAVYGGVAHDR